MTVACTQPGCSGQIEDGYCNVCGAPPDPPAPTLTGGVGASGVGPASVGPAGLRPAGPTTPISGLMTGPGQRSGPISTPTGTPIVRPPGTPIVGSRGTPIVGSRGTPIVGSRGTPASGPISSPSTRTSSQSLASAPLGSVRAGATGSLTLRRLGSTSTRLRGARLGAGITTVPAEPVVDPLQAIMVNPQVPEERRFCPNCGKPVGRSRAGRPGRTEGFCPNCRAPFSFDPKLRAGDLVATQYEVVGCLAFGGLGWIYLARDRNVSDRWVVMKGLLNSGDPDAQAAAIAERQFLAQVEHPLIVEIYNFVKHDDAGYIVMEYVGGKSLKDILKQRMRANGRYTAFGVDQAIAYMVEILPAFGYLHDLGLLYCDFKPDNIIQVGDAVKLIDLGGVRRTDDLESAIYGTVGYQAPEVAQVGPSVASDLYTIGRTLVSLALEFRGNTTTYVASLPPVADTPLFQRYDSLYRLLLKACAPDPSDRFGSADEMRVQLLGVLREVVAADRHGDRPARHSTASPLFEPPVVESDTLDWRNLPVLRVDDADQQAAWLASVSVSDPTDRLAVLQAAQSPSVEVQLAIAQTAVEAGTYDVTAAQVQAMLAEDPWEWRAIWVAGLAALAMGDVGGALAAFNTVYGQVPGELAPKLALALACELGNQPGIAESLYLTCLRTDANYTAPGAFGLARIRATRRVPPTAPGGPGSGAVARGPGGPPGGSAAAGSGSAAAVGSAATASDPAGGIADLGGAIAALDMVPVTSRSFVAARRRRAALLVEHGGSLDAYAAALESVAAISIDPGDWARLRIDALAAALHDVTRSGPQPGVLLGGVPAEEPALRDGLERAYRDLAGVTEDREQRVHLVDAANDVRRWTMR